MVKVLILGSTGMLGNAVAKYFLSLPNFKTYITHRSKLKLNSDSLHFDALTDDLENLPDVDYIINCIGVIKPFMVNKLSDSIYLNSIFPRKLANHCQETHTRLIHITTDCVFSGQEGSYSEDSLHDALDEYGKSKSLGEPDNCMVLRTSIIGKEIHKDASLIAWAVSQKGNNVNGYTNHLWNGITTIQYAKCCESIINKNLYQIGIRHIFSNFITKYDLLQLISKTLDLDLKVSKFETVQKCDRTLSTTFGLNKELNIPPLSTQIEELNNG
tara:strand:+ start:14636 stop:15448 length:813 start_codon:yes stop_codon:yes gene_type:complete